MRVGAGQYGAGQSASPPSGGSPSSSTRRRSRFTDVTPAGAEGPIVREPHQPHYQSLDYNPMHGGVARWFEPLEPVAEDGVMPDLIEFPV